MTCKVEVLSIVKMKWILANCVYSIIQNGAFSMSKCSLFQSTCYNQNDYMNCSFVTFIKFTSLSGSTEFNLKLNESS